MVSLSVSIHDFPKDLFVSDRVLFPLEYVNGFQTLQIKHKAISPALCSQPLIPG